ncbi:MAG: nicotinate phosphoribosyltransferase [Polyangiaceae bacterium]|nr:nicotinate phosphoribosyltransferase [Polyangiaceae bacterium]
MAAGYFHRGMSHRMATCELFIRRLPLARRFLVALGIDAALHYIEHLRFSEEDIAFLRSVPAMRDAMTDDFAAYLRDFSFTGDVWAVGEGTIAFENEPLLRVRAPIIQAQILETFLLSVVNHATMVGSKAARMVIAADGRRAVEFGTRRTHPDAAIEAARDAYAVGFAGTSNVEASRRFGIPLYGTAAHMWTMAHATEEEAFRGYFAVFPKSSILLIDTYDTVRGARRAVQVARDQLAGVRLDSGDLGALAKEVRAVLDAEGAPNAKIVASGDLNEHSVAALVASGAPIDTFGIGTELVCSVDAPSLGGVYKLVEIDEGPGTPVRPIAKFSVGKGTFPGAHQVLRVVDRGVYQEDVVILDHEDSPTLATSDQQVIGLLDTAITAGRRVRPAASLDAVRAHVARGLASLPPAVRSLEPAVPGQPAYSVRPSASLAALIERLRVELV